jgi:hypothetical protein
MGLQSDSRCKAAFLAFHANPIGQLQGSTVLESMQISRKPLNCQ